MSIRGSQIVGLLLMWACLLVVALWPGCEGQEQPTNPETGTVVVVIPPPSRAEAEAAESVWRSGDVAARTIPDYATRFTVIVSGPNMDDLYTSMDRDPAAPTEITIDDVPAGSSRMVEVRGMAADGALVAKGKSQTFAVEPGEIASVAIELDAYGGIIVIVS